MIADALAGKIDLIITKSISRFARNTVDTLTAVRQLKDKGVEVFFEKENIYTMDSKGELLITIMSSLAQEESRSISENVLSRVSSILSRVSTGVGANFLVFYDEKYHRPIFARATKTPKREKARKVWAFCIEKVPTNCIIS